MSMASEAAIAAPIASPIWSLKYGKCHFSGDSTTPSSDTNSDATTFHIRTSSESMFRPNIRQAKYPLVALLRIGEVRRIPLPRTLVNKAFSDAAVFGWCHHAERERWLGNQKRRRKETSSYVLRRKQEDRAEPTRST